MLSGIYEVRCTCKMLALNIIFTTMCLRGLNAVVVDSYYMPSQPREQIDSYESQDVYKNSHSNREKSNEITYDHYVKPQYKYGYSVFDPYTMDMKSQWEHRDGDFVKGAYNVLDADGSMRIVEYISDKDIGFRATVKKIPFYLDELRRQGALTEAADKYPKSKDHYQEPYSQHYQQPLDEEPLHRQLHRQKPVHQLPISHQQPVHLQRIVNEAPIHPQLVHQQPAHPLVHQQPAHPQLISQQPAHPQLISHQPIGQQPKNKYSSQTKHNHYTQKYVHKEKHHKNYYNKVEDPAPVQLYKRLLPVYQ